MVPLMARIAGQLVERVRKSVNVHTIFKQSPLDVRKAVSEAVSLLEGWSEVYFQVRERIEMSGRDQRWEFDRKALFEQTNYMALRLKDLIIVAEVLSQFLGIFGAELKGKSASP